MLLGLGNPGREYKKTRHNVGFLFLDYLREAWEFPPFQENKKFQSEVSTGKRNNSTVILAKPDTFMNKSGTAVQNMLGFYHESFGNIAVIHDDIDIPLGKIKVSRDSRSAGHRGVQDIIDKVGTQEFFRVRVGIGTQQVIQNAVDFQQIPRNTSSFVLEKFSPEEISLLERIFPDMLSLLNKWLDQDSGFTKEQSGTIL